MPRIITLLLSLLIIGCTNNPYRENDGARKVRYATLRENPKSLDPTFTYDSLSLSIVGPIYETLLQYHYLKRPYQLIPALAEEMPIRTDYTYQQDVKAFRYTITIKKGLRFQDDPCFVKTEGKGREVTSDDFIYSLKRIADPSVTCPIRATLGEKIVGLNDFYFANKKILQEQKKKGMRPRTDYNWPVRGIRRINRYKFEISLTECYPQFLYWLAMPFTAPIPREAVEYYDSEQFPERPDFRDHPVGTGAYYLKEYKKGQRMTLARNSNFRKEIFPLKGEPGDKANGLLEKSGKKLPLVDEWIFTTVKETIPNWNLFKQGYLDTSGVPRDAFDRVINPDGGLSREMQARGIQLFRSKQLSTYYFAFNMDDPLVGKNKKLRQAISMAIHTKEYLDLYRNNLGRVAQSPVPPGIFGYDLNYANSHRQFDLKQAKERLAEAGYPNGMDPKTGSPLEISFDTSATDPGGRQETRWLVNQFEQLNILLKVIVNDWNTQQQKADEGNFQFIRYGWFADYPDPENFLFLLYSENRRPGVNYTNYSNPEYDRLFRQMKGMSNEGEEGALRYAIIQKMVKILENDCPWIPNYHPETYSLAHAWCGKIKLHGQALNTLKYAKVDPLLRKQKRTEWNRPNYRTFALMFGLLLAFVGGLSGFSKWRKKNGLG